MAARRIPATSYFAREGRAPRKLLGVLGMLALTGLLAGLFAPQAETVGIAGGWTAVPSWLDLSLSILLVAGAWAVFRFRPVELRWLGMAMSGAASLRYVSWRLTHTLTFEDGWSGTFSLLLFLAEMYTVVLLFVGHFQAFRPIKRITPRMPEDAIWPSLDVYITTLNESVDVVRRTAVGCRAMRYAGTKQVWILDDGCRVEMKRLAEQLGIGYLSRKERDGAKAGNLNAAMARTSGALIAQFDADHVPVRSFLEETVPFLVVDDNLAFVQTPHKFQNADVFQRNLAVGTQVANEQDLFFHVLQPGNDFWNAAFFCGSNAVLRREAIEDVGGFATETITEDAHTSLRMHARSWNSAYLDKPLAGGVTPETFADALAQRMRWCMGMVGIFRRDNPLTIRGLTLVQRVCYFSSCFFFFFGLPRLIFFLAPIAFLLFDVRSIDASILPVIALFLPHVLAGWLATSGASRNYRHTFWSEVYESSMAFYMGFASVWALFTRRKLPFRVTPKDVVREGFSWSLKAAAPAATLMLLTLCAAVSGIAMLGEASREMTGVIVMNLAWSLYNLMILSAAVLVTIDRPQLRRQPRMKVYLPVRVSWSLGGVTTTLSGVATDISEGGASLLVDGMIPADHPLRVTFDPDEEPLTLGAEMVYCRDSEEPGAFRFALRYTEINDADRERLIQWMYCAPTTWSEMPRPAEAGRALARLIGTTWRLLRFREKPSLRREPRVSQWREAILEVGGKRLPISLVDLSQGGALVEVPNGVLSRGQPVMLEIAGTRGEPLTLDGTVHARRGRRTYALHFDGMDETVRVDLVWDLYVHPGLGHADTVFSSEGGILFEPEQPAAEQPRTPPAASA